MSKPQQAVTWSALAAMIVTIGIAGASIWANRSLAASTAHEDQIRDHETRLSHMEGLEPQIVPRLERIEAGLDKLIQMHMQP